MCVGVGMLYYFVSLFMYTFNSRIIAEAVNDAANLPFWTSELAT
jgi:hypothetical protein